VLGGLKLETAGVDETVDWSSAESVVVPLDLGGQPSLAIDAAVPAGIYKELEISIDKLEIGHPKEQLLIDAWPAAAAERRWAASGIRDYDYTVRLYCFCFSLPNTIRFEVRDGVSTAPGATAAALARFARLSTMELVFADVRQTLEREPYRFGADFHPVLGYPRSYYSDQEVMVADDEVGVFITDLVVR